MSDYRYSIIDHHGILCLHVMIDAEPIAETHIPLSDIFESFAERMVKEQPDSESPMFPPNWNTVNGQPFAMPLPDGKPIEIPESWKLPPEMRGKQG